MRKTALSLQTDQIGFGVMVALLLAAPFLFYPVFLMKALCFALFACAFNLLAGYAGLLSFGHATFMGMAAYIAAFTVKSWGFPTLGGILAGTGVAGVMGLVFGWLAIRRQGIYFAMVTLALAQMVYFRCSPRNSTWRHSAPPCWRSPSCACRPRPFPFNWKKFFPSRTSIR